MNDKCAAGTGRFFEMAGRILDTSIYDFETRIKKNVCIKIYTNAFLFSILFKISNS